VAKRFYQVKFKDRPAFFEDLGQSLKITGMMFEGMGSAVLVLTPNSDFANIRDIFKYNEFQEWVGDIISTSWEELSEIIQASDDPKILILDENKNVKAIHRKVQYQVSGAVQQKIWVRDGLKCMFCERKMGDVHLSIDHFIPLELGGDNNPSNYLSACRKCNKRKGSMHPKEYCQRHNLDYDYFVKYLEDIGV
jgi:hypothetical protein